MSGFVFCGEDFLACNKRVTKASRIHVFPDFRPVGGEIIGCKSMGFVGHCTARPLACWKFGSYA